MQRLLVICLLLLGVGIMGTSAQPTPRIEPVLCPFGNVQAQTIDCFRLYVPENRARSDSPTISLAVAIIRASNPNPQPDPILYLEGGPGGSALMSRDMFFNTAFGRDRDIILLDQRGTGYSSPALVCDDDSETVESTRICRDELRAQGIDLSAYNSAESAADIQDLRAALGINQLNLYGISYGTRLALTVLRDDDSGIRSVIIDGVYPPNVDSLYEIAGNAQRAFEAIFSACASNAACNAAFPDLETVFYEVIDFMNEEPLEFDDGELTGDDLVNLLFEAIYSAEVVRYVPALLYGILEDDYDLLEDLLDDVLGVGEEDDDLYDNDLYGDLFIVYFELLADALGYDDLSEFLDDFLDMDEEEMAELLEDFIDALDDDDFDLLFALFLGFDNEDELYDWYDEVDEDEFFVLFDELLFLLTDGILGDTAPDSSDGMYNSVECYEEVPFNDLDTAFALSEQVADLFVRVMLGDAEDTIVSCELWGVNPPDPRENEPVISNIPVLILSGEFDPITPPAWGDVALAGFTGAASHVVFPALSHGTGVEPGCPQALMTQFLNNPTADPLSNTPECRNLGTPSFFLP